jgi:hypothetical protein
MGGRDAPAGCDAAVAALASGIGAERGIRGSGIGCYSLLKRLGSGGRSHDSERGRERGGCQDRARCGG